jgi:hypothetical protein
MCFQDEKLKAWLNLIVLAFVNDKLKSHAVRNRSLLKNWS